MMDWFWRIFNMHSGGVIPSSSPYPVCCFEPMTPTMKELDRNMRRMRRALRGEPLSYIEELPAVAQRHVDRLTEAHKHYGDSWIKRGGVGAMMMLARKWDRIELRVGKPLFMAADPGEPVAPDGTVKWQPHTAAGAWDIIEHIKADPRPEGVADDVADLIDYLMLIEAKLRHEGGLPQDTEQYGFTRPDISTPFGYEPDEQP